MKKTRQVKKVRQEQKQKSQEAFTLVELLVVLGIFSVLMAALLQFLTNFLNLQYSAEARTRIRNEGNVAIDQIEFLVRNGVTIPNVCREKAEAESSGDTPGCHREEGANCQNLKVNLNDNGEIVKYEAKVDDEGAIVLIETRQNLDIPEEMLIQTRILTAIEGQTKNAPVQVMDAVRVAEANEVIEDRGEDEEMMKNFGFSCVLDEFTGGLLVTIQVPMEVKRQSIQAQEDEQLQIYEQLTREVAVRNRFTYE